MAASQSQFIGTKAASTTYYAAVQAERIGLPLNRVVTINYSCCPEIEPWEAPAAFKTLRNHYFAPFSRRPGLKYAKSVACAPTYVFTFENERDGQAFLTMKPGDPHNVHVHWHVHVKPERFHEFEGIVWEWLWATAGPCTANAIKITGPQSSGYLNKGARERDVEIYGRGHKARPQGIICGGRRTGSTINIGPQARRTLDKQLKIQRRLPTLKGTPYYKQAAI